MDLLNSPMAYFTIGCWVGVFMGILVLALLRQQDED